METEDEEPLIDICSTMTEVAAEIDEYTGTDPVRAFIADQLRALATLYEATL